MRFSLVDKSEFDSYQQMLQMEQMFYKQLKKSVVNLIDSA
jgi:hypothetical protein